MEEYIQSQAMLVFGLVMVAAALLHWGQKVHKGEATGDFVGYWLTETPGYTLGTVGALAGTWWLVYTTDGLTGMAAHMIVSGAFTAGWAIDSAVAPGSGAVATKAANKVAGFVRPYLLPVLLLLAASAMLAGCASLGLTPPDTFDEKLAYAVTQHTAIVKTTIQSLNAHAISSSEAESVQKMAKESRLVLDGAFAASQLGDISAANGKLLLATSILTTLQSYLNSRSK